jgi:hypothetical protein
MCRRLLAVALVGIALVACSDHPQQESPITPQFATNSTDVCDPSVFNGLIGAYFSPPRLQTAQDEKDLMLANLPSEDSTVARTHGFNLMREVAAAAKEGATKFDDGSELTRETLKCIFDVTDTNVVIGFASLSFATQLNPAIGGAYEVRAGLGDLEDPVLALNSTATEYLSGVALPDVSSGPAHTWAGVASERVLSHGFPGLPVTSYDWSAIPRRTNFDPGVTVGLCVPDGTQSMIQQAGQFVLAFQEASYFLDDDGNDICTASLASATAPGRLLAVGRQLREWGQAAFGVTALQASMVSPGLTGGRAGSLKSLFDDKLIGEVTLEWLQEPEDALVNQEIPPPPAVKATSTAGPMAGVPVTLLLVTNNGKTVQPSNNVATTQIEFVQGQPVAIARFTGMSVNKSGGYAAVIQPTQVPGRAAITVSIPVPRSKRFNVRPLK